jgi:transposase
MLTVGLNHRVWIYEKAIDMRKSYDSLYGLVRAFTNPLSGDVFVFLSRDRKKVKALFWDGSGLNIWMKRLEKGRFADVFSRSEMTLTELKLLFEGSHKVTERISGPYLTDSFQP